MTWHPIKTRPPTAADWIKDKQAVELYCERDGSRMFMESPRYIDQINPAWTHWRHVELAPPPEKLPTVQELDRQEFWKWRASLNGAGYDQPEIWLAARKSLREEIRQCFEQYGKITLRCMIDESAARTENCWTEALRQLSRLLEGEEGK